MRNKVKIRKFFYLTLTILILKLTVFAQSESGSASLEGTVRDQNGAVIRGATVIVKNTETVLERTVTTNGEGSFSVTVLPVGTYSVAANASGFQKTPVCHLLHLQQRVSADRANSNWAQDFHSIPKRNWFAKNASAMIQENQ
jgi:Carboxypeptidase regulatory-like domain